MSADILTDRQFADFSEVITTQLGIKMPASKKTMIQGRLFRRVRDLGLGSFKEYHQWFFSHPGAQESELEHLLNLATTNKTDFFRESAHFDFLANEVISEWRQTGGSREFCIWSAGCSSGEEPYTLAMALMELQAQDAFDFTVLATDVSTKVLRKAVDAVYAEDHAAAIPSALRSKYLLRGRDKSKKQVRVAPEVRAHVRFGVLNFLAERYKLPFRLNAIFFRNVMIYFDRDTQQRIVEKMCKHLYPGGYLFVGHSESLNGLDLPITPVRPAVYVINEK